ncbi:MAG: uroporphyrinogen decarboxylase family protein [Armatimonadota bacterium]|nr:hypothetical protein [bacterium]
MQSKELVYSAIEFRNPPKVPIYYFNRDFARSDVVATCYSTAVDFSPDMLGQTEWGYIWQTLDGTMGQPQGVPLAEPADFKSYVAPDPWALGRLDHVDAFIAENKEQFLVFTLGITGFNSATFLRGFENLLTDLYTDRALAAKALDFVFNFENGLVEQVVKHEVDAVKFSDDWGTQQGLMISPELWRDEFKPRYAEQFEMARKSGKKTWFHSCGNVHEIIPDMIDIGLDVIELLQPDIFGVEQLAKEFGGDICFCCSIDHQRKAISGTRQEIRDYAKLLVEKLGAFKGGFIAYIENYPSLGMSEQTYQWICEAFRDASEGRIG